LLINRRSNFSYFPLAVSLFLIGCRSSPESEPRSNYLVVGIESNPLQLDPRYSTDANGVRIGGLIYNSLLRADEHMRLQPELAERWTAPDDRTYLFDLRGDAKFHDGKPLTAEDVRYTYESILNPKSLSPKRGMLKPLDGIDVLGPHRVRFRLSAPHAPFLEQFTIGIVPDRVIGGRKVRDALAENAARQDVIITTAQVPGRRPPLLVTADAVKGMKPGSVIVDMAANALGGNVELSKADERVMTDNGVTILAPTNMPATMPAGASQFYARNVSTFLLHFLKDGALNIDPNDEITTATLITHDGAVVQAATKALLDKGAAS